MNQWSLPIDVMLFELRRSFTVGRVLMWVMLVGFPVAIFTAVNLIARYKLGDGYTAEEVIQPFGFILYVLIPEVSCLLGLLLWATPAVSTEIEGQTWVYLSTRRSGRRSVLIGKYLTAVVWTLAAATVSITACCIVIGPSIAYGLWASLLGVAFWSCVVHGALFILIGTLFPRRTMVAAVFYTLVVEFGVSFIPALVNKATINYRLRGLLAQWMGWDDMRSRAEDWFGTEPVSTHLMVLFGTAVVLLLISLVRVETAEYPTQQES